MGVLILKQAPFRGVNFSLVRNMRGGGGSYFMTQQHKSREFDFSDLFIHRHKWLSFNILNKCKK